VRSCFANQGEICLCSSRIFVHRSIFQSFLDAFIKCANALTIGNPTGNVDLGALISREHLEKVVGFIELARSNGHRVLGKGRVTPSAPCDKGYFVAPTVVLDADESSPLMQEEIFGPVVCIVPFDEQTDAIRMANNVKYGLSASVWSSNLDEIHSTAEKLEVGTVWCNCWLVRELNMPFGGVKASGMGREGRDDSIEFYTHKKTVCIRL